MDIPIQKCEESEKHSGTDMQSPEKCIPQNPEDCGVEFSFPVRPEPHNCEESPADEDNKSMGGDEILPSSPMQTQCDEIESPLNPRLTNSVQNSPAKSAAIGQGESKSSPPHLMADQTVELQRVEVKVELNNKPSKGRCIIRRKGREKEKIAGVGRRVCKGAASYTADCTAICCCPCVLAHLFVLAIVKIPYTFAKKVLRKAGGNNKKKKKKNDDEDDDSDDNKTEKCRSFTRPWSLTETPEMSGPLDCPPDASSKDKADANKFWSELYASGHMGFGGPQLERH